jgi:hypothetical protein
MGIFQSTEKEKVEIRGRCRIWTGVNHSQFIFPELNGECPELTQKINYGIALSGGGCRALTYSIGTLRGLHMMNFLTNARYVSTNSGSSWLNGPAAHTRTDLAEFLGQYLPPEQCSKKALKYVDHKSHAFFLCDGHNVHTFLRELRESLLHQDGDDLRSFWSQAIGHIFFKYYDLNHFDHLPVMAGPNEDLIESETNVPKNKMTSYDPSRYPFPILNGSVVIRGHEISAPLEFTPLYYGIPGYFKYEDDQKSFPVGGCLIEPFGFTSTPSEQQRRSIKNLLDASDTGSLTNSSVLEGIASPSVFTVEVPKPEVVISVSEQAGISSSAIAQVVAHSVTTSQSKRLHMTVRPLWNPLSGETHQMIMSDGLGGDNTAIHSLLRRKVHKICATFAINLSLMEPVDHRNASQSSFADIAALFGVMTCDHTTIDGVLPEDFNQYRHVFPSEDYEILFTGLRERCSQGKPCTFLLHTRALPNSFVGIPGGHSVDLLLIICAPSECWMNSLPDETRLILARRREKDESDDKDDDKEDDQEEDEGQSVLEIFEEIFHDISEELHEVKAMLRQIFRKSDLRDFPFPISESMNYSPQLVNLMTNLMTWEVLESRDLFEEFLKESNSPQATNDYPHRLETTESKENVNEQLQQTADLHVGDSQMDKDK